MFAALKNHPFAVEAFFDTSVVVTYAFPKEVLEPLIPKCLSLDTFDDKYAFIAVALVQTKALRPKGFPKFFGNDFFLIGYRIFVQYTDNRGRKLRGLYILKSETDKKKMEFLGNIFTHYSYSTTDLLQKKNRNILSYQSIKSGIEIEVELNDKNAGLPAGSPFQDWKEARRFVGPLPFTFTYLKEKRRVLIVEGMRQDWQPKPVKILKANVAFIESMNLQSNVLANGFIVQNIPYHWKKGRLEQWQA